MKTHEKIRIDCLTWKDVFAKILSKCLLRMQNIVISYYKTEWGRKDMIVSSWNYKMEEGILSII